MKAEEEEGGAIISLVSEEQKHNRFFDKYGAKHERTMDWE